MSTVICDRCHHEKEGSDLGVVTTGYYRVDQAPWSRYARPGERVVCDDCMWVDPGYSADYSTPKPAVLSFEHWRAYLDEHDPDGSRNLWGFALPMMSEAYAEGRRSAASTRTS